VHRVWQGHTLVLLQATASRNTRTFHDYETLNDALDGRCCLYNMFKSVWHGSACALALYLDWDDPRARGPARLRPTVPSLNDKMLASSLEALRVCRRNLRGLRIQTEATKPRVDVGCRLTSSKYMTSNILKIAVTRAQIGT
jgi:hypothetical protein